MRYGPRLSGVGVHVGIFQGWRGWRSVRRSRSNAEGSRVYHMREAAVGVTRSRAWGRIVRMEMPKAFARAAARAPVHGSGALPIVVQDLSCADARVAGE